MIEYFVRQIVIQNIRILDNFNFLDPCLLGEVYPIMVMVGGFPTRLLVEAFPTRLVGLAYNSESCGGVGWELKLRLT